MKMVLVNVNDVKNALHDAVDDISLGYYAVEGIREDDIDKIVDGVPRILSDENLHEIEEAINIFRKDIRCCEIDDSECLKHLVCDECTNYQSVEILENAERTIVKYYDALKRSNA